MARDTVYIFTRAPRLGTVKRRLARAIGPRAALRFHLATLHRLARASARIKRWRTILAVTPDGAHIAGLPGIPRVPQGRGNLGARMARVLAMTHHGRAVIIGSDIPHATPADLRAAFAALGRTDAVFGPAQDGGYWLIGQGPRRPAAPFARVRWSSAHALADTLANFRRHRVATLRMLRDVDTAADLAALTPPP